MFFLFPFSKLHNADSHMWKLKVKGTDPYIAASCSLQPVAGSERWGTMVAASWGSTYTDRTHTTQL